MLRVLEFALQCVRCIRSPLKMQLIVFVSLLAAAIAAPRFVSRDYQQQYYQPQYYAKPNVPILVDSKEANPDGSFRYRYATGDGQQAQAQGYLKHGYGNEEAEVVQGSYSYTSPDGTPIQLSYVADENGFRAEGEHLPTPPPIPEPILRSLAINAQRERNQYQPQYQPQYQQSQYKPYRPKYGGYRGY